MEGVGPHGDLSVVQTAHSLEVVADLDRRRAEALALELRALARRYGLGVRVVYMLPEETPTAGAKGAGSDLSQ